MIGQKISHFLDTLQHNLFPTLREELPEASVKHERITRVLEMLQPEQFVSSRSWYLRGRPKHDRAPIVRAFIAKAVLGLAKTTELLDRLKYDRVLLRICGWERTKEIPSESTFSRAFGEFANTRLPEKIHACLIELTLKDEVIEHISRDASDIPAREKAPKKDKKKKPKVYHSKKEKTVVHGQIVSCKSAEELIDEQPKECGSGCKVSPKGNSLYWMGFKLHVDITDQMIPIAAVVTSARAADVALAAPLSMLTSSRTTVLYELMDKGYRSNSLMEYIEAQGRVPIASKAARGRKQKAALSQEKKARETLQFGFPEDRRLKKRTVAERFFSHLKDNYGCRNFYYRKHLKVSCHIMFAVLAMAAERLMAINFSP